MNPRRAINPCWFSRPVHSAALPPLLQICHVVDGCYFHHRPLVLPVHYSYLPDTRPSGRSLRALCNIVPDDIVSRSATSPVNLSCLGIVLLLTITHWFHQCITRSVLTSPYGLPLAIQNCSRQYYTRIVVILALRVAFGNSISFQTILSAALQIFQV